MARAIPGSATKRRPAQGLRQSRSGDGRGSTPRHGTSGRVSALSALPGQHSKYIQHDQARRWPAPPSSHSWRTDGGSALVWRVALPLWRILRHGLRVTAVVRESSDVVSVYLTGRRLDRLPVRAGQFLNVRFLDGPGMTRANPFSLSAAPSRGLRITAKGPRRREHSPRAPAAGHPSDVRGALRPAQRPSPQPAKGRPGRAPSGYHAAPLAGRGIGLRARRSDPALPLHR